MKTVQATPRGFHGNSKMKKTKSEHEMRMKQMYEMKWK
jgi:hypothetical protein